MTEPTLPPEAPDDDAPPLPIEIVSQALHQFAEFLKEASESADDNCFEDPNAHNNALVSSIALLGFVPNMLASDYVQAQKCLAELMSALFTALQIPRRSHGAFAAGMLDGITAEKAREDGGGILKPSGVEVSRYGKLMARNGKRHGGNRKGKGK